MTKDPALIVVGDETGQSTPSITWLNVLSMFEWWISQGDPYAGMTLLAWHGQNNQPSSEANAAQIRWVSLRMAELAGARDARMLFLSVLGQRNHAWSGSRITVSQHENQWNRTGYLYDLNQWYAATFPGRWISPWQVLLAAATDAPDPTFPGLTEKQVSATYGIVPWSFYGSPGGAWTTGSGAGGGSAAAGASTFGSTFASTTGGGAGSSTFGATAFLAAASDSASAASWALTTPRAVSRSRAPKLSATSFIPPVAESNW